MLGNFLTVLIGPTLPVPAPPQLMRNLEQVSVQLSDTGRNGFQLSFRVGRESVLGALDYPPVLEQLVKPGNRVILMSTVNAVPHVLMDGVITNLQLSPSAEPGGGKLSVTGQDISVMMELIEAKTPYPGLNDFAIVTTILAKYAVHGVTPLPIPPPGDVPPLVTDRMPIGDGSDFAILNRLAGHYGYVFWVQAGPLPGQSLGYWGPPIQIPVPQKALSFRAGSATNLGSIQFSNDATKAYSVFGVIQDRLSGTPTPIVGVPLAIPPKATLPAWIGNAPLIRVRQLGTARGSDAVKAFVKAAADAARSGDSAVTASGELDVGAYGSVLRARELVGLRGVGWSFDGLWYVKSVSHTIGPGSHKQSFNLEREGTLSNVPMVRP